MPYRFATERRDYSDYSSGRVFYGAPGHPAFPVRLVSEIFQRCLAVRRTSGLANPVVLYDPCCGGAYHLSTLAYLHWHAIDAIMGSDIDANILSVAARNLGLLTVAGLERRKEEIETMLVQYGKSSHEAALESVLQFTHQLHEMIQTHRVETHLFLADATNCQELSAKLAGQQVDVVISDIPYGQRSAWQMSGQMSAPSSTSSKSPVWQMLAALQPLLSTDSVVAIAADKGQQVVHEKYRRVERFRVGKRQIVLLQPTIT